MDTMKFELVDCRPVPRKLAPTVREIKNATGAVLASCDRSQAGVNYARSQGCTLSSQAELYNGFQQGRPGFNPANPPGRSTHERRSDGVAFAGPVGRPLFYWQVGMDWTNAPAVVQAASRLGYTATITYPNNPREGHHVNFRKQPLIKHPVLKRGMKGPRVKRLERRMRFLHDPQSDHPYLRQPVEAVFDGTLEAAVQAFQADHGQLADGIVGEQTKRQLKVSTRREKKRRKEWKKELEDLRKIAAKRRLTPEQKKRRDYIKGRFAARRIKK